MEVKKELKDRLYMFTVYYRVVKTVSNNNPVLNQVIKALNNYKEYALKLTDKKQLQEEVKFLEELLKGKLIDELARRFNNVLTLIKAKLVDTVNISSIKYELQKAIQIYSYELPEYKLNKNRLQPSVDRIKRALIRYAQVVLKLNDTIKLELAVKFLEKLLNQTRLTGDIKHKFELVIHLITNKIEKLSNDINKIKRIQTVVRNRQTIQTQYVNALVRDLQKEKTGDDETNKNINYYTQKIIKVHKEIPSVLKNTNLMHNAHSVITTRIAPCHIRTGQDPVMYLRQLRNQLHFAAKLYHRKKIRNPKFPKKFFKRLHAELGGRPCLENLIEGLSVALTDPEFVWTGRNVKDPLTKNNTRYNNIINKAVKSFQKYHNNTNNVIKLPMTLERRKNFFWNMIKNKNVFAVTNNSVGYVKVNKYNKGGRRFRSSPSLNLLNYIQRKNVNTENFKKTKKIVNRLESGYNPLFALYKRANPGKTNSQILGALINSFSKSKFNYNSNKKHGLLDFPNKSEEEYKKMIQHLNVLYQKVYQKAYKNLERGTRR